MAKKYLDSDGLLYLWQKIKNLFTLKSDSIKNITRSGTTFTATRADGTTFTFTQQDNTVAKTSTTPKMNGTAAIGSETKYAAGDHVHPSDTTKVDKVEGKGLSTNDYTTTEKNKLAGIATGAEVNQNAFSNVKVGDTTISADTKTDTLTLVAGSNVTFTSDTTKDTITIAATDTKYSAATATPTMNGNAAVGTSSKYAREDHVHPSDTTKVDKVEGKGLSTNDYTTAEMNKLAGIAAGAEVNQNAFGNFKVGSTTVAADAKTDTLEFVAGSNVTLTPDATNDKITIAATDTTYSEATTSAAGLMSAADKTKLNGIQSWAEANQNAFSIVKIGSTNVVADDESDTLEFVAGSNVTLTPDATNDKITIAATDTTYSEATTSAAGLMSASDKEKLDGISAGAEVNQSAFSAVKVGNAYYYADTKRDALELIAGNHISIAALSDAGAQSVTISSNGEPNQNAYYRLEFRDAANTTIKATLAAGTTSSTATFYEGDNISLDSIVTTSGTGVKVSANLHKGEANGVCPLNASSKIDSTYLPSFVDDVIEAYARSGQTALSQNWLATGSATGTVITPEAGKIYILMADSGDYAANTQFRWSGTTYVKLNDGGVSAITNAEIDTIVAS